MRFFSIFQHRISNRKNLFDQFNWIVKVRYLTSLIILVVYFFGQAFGWFDYHSATLVFFLCLQMLLNQPYNFILKRLKDPQRFFIFNQLIDVLLTVGSIHIVGNHDIFYILLIYPIMFIYSGIVFSPFAAFFFSNIAFVSYISFVFLQSMGLVHIVGMQGVNVIAIKEFDFIVNVLIYNVFGFFICYLHLLLQGREEDLRQRNHDLRKERDTVLKLANEANLANQAKSLFLASMSHELRTPLNAINGFTELLKSTGLDADQKEYVYTISSSGDMLLNLINDILDLSKLEAGKVELEHIDFNLSYLILDIFKMVQAEFSNKPIDVYIDIARDVPQQLKGDPTRLKQIFLNLISNAFKFTEDGEIGVAVVVDHNNSEGEELSLILTVKDTGIGISENKEGVIFESFSQADSSTTRQFGGTGLGLAICRRLIEAMKGNIRVHSEIGKGSDFIFNIKLMKSNEVDVACDHANIRNKKVILIDSNVRSLNMMNEFCQDMGLNVITSLNSKEAALQHMSTYLDNHKGVPDAIICNSEEGKVFSAFIDKLRSHEKCSCLKIMAITSQRLSLNKSKEHSQNADLYMLKPVIKDEFEKYIFQLLDSN